MWKMLPCPVTSSLAERGRGNERESQGSRDGRGGGGALLLCQLLHAEALISLSQALMPPPHSLSVPLSHSVLHSPLVFPLLLSRLFFSSFLAVSFSLHSFTVSLAVNFRGSFLSRHLSVWMSVHAYVEVLHFSQSAYTHDPYCQWAKGQNEVKMMGMRKRRLADNLRIPQNPPKHPRTHAHTHTRSKLSKQQ